MYAGSIMLQEYYSLDNNLLRIIDPEMGLHIEEPCLLPQFAIPIQDKEFYIKEEMHGPFRHVYYEYQQSLHGEYRQYDESNFLFSSIFYAKGKMHGPSCFFTKEGGYLAKSWFYHGVLQGKAHKYYMNGGIYSIQRYKDGSRHGKQEFFYESGSVKTFLNYTLGNLDGLSLLFWNNGIKKREINFVGGLKHGYEQIWDKNGKLIESTEYRMGEKISL